MAADRAVQGFESPTFLHTGGPVGYYTNFKVSFKQVAGQDPHLPFLQSDEPVACVPTLNMLLDSAYDTFSPNGWSTDQLKWYEWESDMMEASARMPGVLITLTGSGEEDGDLWRAYFLDGRVQSVRPSIEFPPFDPAQLRDKPHLASRNQIDIWS